MKEVESATHCVAMELRLEVEYLHDSAADTLTPKAAETDTDQRTTDFLFSKSGINSPDALREKEALDQLIL